MADDDSGRLKLGGLIDALKKSDERFSVIEYNSADCRNCASMQEKLNIANETVARQARRIATLMSILQEHGIEVAGLYA